MKASRINGEVYIPPRRTSRLSFEWPRPGPCRKTPFTPPPPWPPPTPPPRPALLLHPRSCRRQPQPGSRHWAGSRTASRGSARYQSRLHISRGLRQAQGAPLPHCSLPALCCNPTLPRSPSSKTSSRSSPPISSQQELPQRPHPPPPPPLAHHRLPRPSMSLCAVQRPFASPWQRQPLLLLFQGQRVSCDPPLQGAGLYRCCSTYPSPGWLTILSANPSSTVGEVSSTVGSMAQPLPGTGPVGLGMRPVRATRQTMTARAVWWRGKRMAAVMGAGLPLVAMTRGKRTRMRRRPGQRRSCLTNSSSPRRLPHPQGASRLQGGKPSACRGRGQSRSLSTPLQAEAVSRPSPLPPEPASTRSPPPRAAPRPLPFSRSPWRASAFPLTIPTSPSSSSPPHSPPSPSASTGPSQGGPLEGGAQRPPSSACPCRPMRACRCPAPSCSRCGTSAACWSVWHSSPSYLPLVLT